MRNRKAALFLTCSAEALYPSVGVHVVRVLKKLGVSVSFPESQSCCGQPWLNSGDVKSARSLALKFLAEFEEAEAVVSPSSSCVDTIRNRYMPLFSEEPALAGRFAALGGRTYEFCEYLYKVMGVESFPALPSPVRTTYHSSCRTLRGVGLKGIAERYLVSMVGDSFVELPEADTCCGFGGSFSVKFPEVSGKMMDDKLKCIQSTGAKTVAALDMSCLTHLSGGAKRLGLNDLSFVHFAKLADEALNGGGK